MNYIFPPSLSNQIVQPDKTNGLTAIDDDDQIPVLLNITPTIDYPDMAYLSIDHHRHHHPMLNHSTSSETDSSLIKKPEEKSTPGLFAMLKCHRFVICLLAIIVILLAITAYSVTLQYRYNQICLSKECVKEGLSSIFVSNNCIKIIPFLLAAKIIKSIDQSVDPCQDFYKFSCGQWMIDTPIPEHKALENKFDQLADKLNREIRGKFNEIMPTY